MKTNSPGKINLFLDVTAKRENGYHEILTLFLPIHDLSDTIEISSSSGLEINSNHPGVPQDETNLCHKAATLFSKKTGITPNWQIHISKKLPVAGGMGGGSSNAAITLKLLNEKYDLPLTLEELAEIALSIGADVPYFLNPVPSLAQGIGEALETLQALHKVPLL
ncbi:MAG: 4-(cytidine 5'-diphospho)-2-C-methyl-D-erythritol kinase [Lentisphaerales bacterium]|nr:4-(cytidine 5'-diphospho)-2-C-methyl-D-erythritol kinase [Lentisphaerales bacterium]